MTEEIQVIETILERDTDIILLEELNVNDSFANWVVTQLQLPKLTKNIGTWRSISHFGLGETDLLFSYQSGQFTIFVLIENKLDAIFQDQQYERYQKRGNQYIIDKKCSKCFSILVAPKQYVEGQNNFEKYLTYEEIRDFFQTINSERHKFKANLLNIAIEKLRRGYQPINCEPVQRFWEAYWKYKEKEYPTFKMKKPLIVPVGSDWIELRIEELKGISFYHKLHKGYVDATFDSFSEDFELKLEEILPYNYKIEKHKSGRFSLRQSVNPIDRTLDFEGQEDKVKIGLQKVKEISEWIKQQINRNATS